MNKLTILGIILTATIFSSNVVGNESTLYREVRGSYGVEYEYLNNLRAVKRAYIRSFSRGNIIQREDLSRSEVKAFAKLVDGICYIVMAKPEKYKLKELETIIGHEHLHCMLGKWHGLGGRKNYPDRVGGMFDIKRDE